jgi:DNA-binding response OmpR family regulator
LLIEAHKPLVRAVKRGLEEAGFAVDSALDGADGDSKARNVCYDAIILDASLPQVDGLSLLKALRRDGFGTPVVLLSARGTIEDKVHGLDCGADDYLTKPFHLEELTARLRAVTRRDRERANVLRIHDLEIDCSHRTVRRGNTAIPLTRREYELLKLLAAHRGEVVTRSMIWEQLYDAHDANSSNVVDVYIRYLRLKIDKGFAVPLILTRWGQGYMLRGDDDDAQTPDLATAKQFAEIPVAG